MVLTSFFFGGAEGQGPGGAEGQGPIFFGIRLVRFAFCHGVHFRARILI